MSTDEKGPPFGEPFFSHVPRGRLSPTNPGASETILLLKFDHVKEIDLAGISC